jgi:MYXO-CTERM domain-containing protein
MQGKAWVATVLSVLLCLVFGGTAYAGAGNFSVKTNNVAESNGEWHVKVRIDLPRAPGMMHIPMRFTFSKEVVDERAIMQKGADPVHHRMVLDTPPKQIQSMDVDFADASGKTFKSTYFEFDLRRDGGYFEAGEYLVSLSGPDGDVGGSQKITLTGDNPPVYRGAMDFASGDSGKKKGNKNIQNVSSGLDGGQQVASNDDSSGSSAAPASTDVAPEGNGGDMVPSSAYNKTAEEEAVQGHPSGCGCVAAGSGTAVGVLSLPLAGAVALVLARRRRDKRDRA